MSNYNEFKLPINNKIKMLLYILEEYDIYKSGYIADDYTERTDTLIHDTLINYINNLKGILSKNNKLKNNITSQSKGRINVAETYSKGLNKQGKMLCQTIKVESNTIENKIIKYTLKYILNTNCDDIEIKEKITRTLYLFKNVNNISYINENDILNIIKLNKHPIYTKIIKLCYIILNNKLTTNIEYGDLKTDYSSGKDYLNSTIFETFIRKVIQDKFNTYYHVDTTEYNTVGSTDIMSLDYKTDLVIRDKNKSNSIIIECKLYSKILTDSRKIRNTHMNQLDKYIDLEKQFNNINNAIGCLIYGETIEMNNIENINGAYSNSTNKHKYVYTLNLDLEFKQLINEIQTIANELLVKIN